MADALLSATGGPMGTPVTPQVVAGHHHLHTQPLLTGMTHLQLGPRQLDFGAASKQAWQPCSPMDSTPSTVCTHSPITPAPRTRPVLHGGRQQTVFENETPDRPYQPMLHQSFHTLGQQHFIVKEVKGVCRQQSPVASRKGKTGEDTPPVTPPRKFDLGFADGLRHDDGGADPSSAQRHHSPPSSVAKTPSYGMGWVRSTPSPQSMYRDSAFASCYADTAAHACMDSRPHFMAEVPSMLPQQPQYPIHHLHSVPWAMSFGAC